MIRRLLVTASAAIALGAGLPAQADLIIDYATFTGACGTSLTCAGSAGVAPDGALRLTPAAFNNAGAGYSTTPVELGVGATFSTTFQFRMSDAGGIDPADGFTFVVARASTGLGGVGGGLGYQGVANSIAIEFDTYDNGEAGASNHVALDVNGSLSSLVTVSPYGISSCHLGNHLSDGCLSNGKVWSATINYDGTTQKLNVSVQQEGMALLSLITDHIIDIGAVLGAPEAFVGFTAATGSGFQNHDILNWRLATDTSITADPGTVPEPASLALVGLAGIAALWGARRRRA
jgi:hypothetical protein